MKKLYYIVVAILFCNDLYIMANINDDEYIVAIGGRVAIKAQNDSTTDDGGDIIIQAGPGGSTSGAGGNVEIIAGTGSGSDPDGRINVNSDMYFASGVNVDFSNAHVIGGSDTSAYQELLVAERTGIIQLQFPYNINTRYVTTSTTGAGAQVVQTNNQAQLSSGTTSAGSATLVSRDRLNHQPGQGCSCIFAARYSTGVANNIQEVGIGNTQDGLFFGYNGTTFGVLSRRNSVNTWVAQSSWNGDVMDGTGTSGVMLNPSNGNVYKIEYKGIGFGTVKFYIENPNDGTWILVHTIQYPNSTTNTLFLNSSLQLRARTLNAGNTSNISIFVASMGAFIDGRVNTSIDIRNSFNANQSSVGTGSQTALFTIRNKTTYQSKTNQVMIYPDKLSFLNTTGADTIYRVVLNSTLSGSPVFSDIATNSSVVEASSTASITSSGGTTLFTFFSIGTDKTEIDLSKHGIQLSPGDSLAITAQTLSGSTTAYVSLSWIERF